MWVWTVAVEQVVVKSFTKGIIIIRTRDHHDVLWISTQKTQGTNT